MSKRSAFVSPFDKVNAPKVYVTITGRTIHCTPMGRKAELAFLEADKQGTPVALVEAINRIVYTHVQWGPAESPRPLPSRTQLRAREQEDILLCLRDASYGPEIDFQYQPPGVVSKLTFPADMRLFPRHLYVPPGAGEDHPAAQINRDMEEAQQRVQALQVTDMSNEAEVKRVHDEALRLYDAFRWTADRQADLPPDYVETLPETYRLERPMASFGPAFEDLDFIVRDVLVDDQTRMVRMTSRDNNILTPNEASLLCITEELIWPSQTTHLTRQDRGHMEEVIKSMSSDQKATVLAALDTQGLGRTDYQVDVAYERRGQRVEERIRLPFDASFFAPRRGSTGR